jgi:hypothetical protein
VLELFAEAIRPINLAFTILLAVIVLYWVLVSFGALGLDLGGDAELEGDADGGWLSSILGFINIGEVPVTIVLSFLALFAWAQSIVVNYYLTGGSTLLGLAAIVPILCVSAVATRFCTMPFRPLMRALNRDREEHLPIVGRTCQIMTTEANAQFGQAQIETKGAPVVINVRIADGAPLLRGSTGLIVRQDSERDVYYVVPLSSDRLE